MTISRLVPTLCIVQNTLAAIVYLCMGDWKRAIYWACAAVITWTVTY